ncbi:MAG: uL15 family ribosomal protein [Candidatus Aenigmatarchaeota archaeon]
MTIRFRKKVRKMRGSHTHGYGSKKKHRGGGSRGGRGYGGSHKHKYSYIVKYEPWHYGYKGFHSLKKKLRTINIGDLEKISDNNEIDLTKLGYDKLLSRGKISRPLIIKIKKFSKKAKEKIEKVGGKIIIEE